MNNFSLSFPRWVILKKYDPIEIEDGNSCKIYLIDINQGILIIEVKFNKKFVP